jgi:amino acid adenylation domain-containing protein
MQTMIDRSYRLSPQQRRVWSLQENFSAAPFFAQCHVLVEGKADKGALRAAVQDVIERHEIFRTRFQLVERDDGRFAGGSVCEQVVGDTPEAEVREIDLEHDGKLDDVIRSVHEAAGWGDADFDWGPLAEACVATLAPGTSLLSFRASSLLADRASMNNLLPAIVNSYSAAVGREGEPEEPIQYADLAEWQNDLLESEDTEMGRRYWASSGPSDPAAYGLEARVEDGFSPRSVEAEMSASDLRGIDAVAAKHRATAGDFILNCWRILLARMTGEGSVAVAVAFDGRRSEEVRQAIGPLTKHIPVAVDVAEEESFARALTRISEAVAEASKWQEYFDWARIEAPEGDGLPFSRFCFDFHEISAPLAAAGAVFSIADIRAMSERFVANLSCARGTDRLRLAVEYDPKVIGHGEASRLLANLVELIRNAAAGADSAIRKLNSVSREEREKLLVEWNRTEVEYPTGCLHEWIEAQAARTPEAVAVVFEDRRLTYGELDARANQLAHALRGLGVGPEVLVGLCMERSLELMVGLLGVLKAGGAYAPLDPEFPAERLAWMLGDTRAKVVLTQERLKERLGACEARVLCLDSEWAEIGKQSEDRAESGVRPENLAYVIYTSGSTGKPKGAMNTHRGIVNRLLWMQEAYQLGPEDRVFQKTTYSFDVSVWEFFWPLMTGAEVVLGLPGGQRDSAYLARTIAERKITTMHFVPSQLGAFLEEPDLSGCESLRRVICSGEELPRELQERYYDRLPGSLHNLYGPTEAAVDVSYWACERGARGERVPIGQPIANTQLYALDGGSELKPIGAAGELCIGGVGVGRGYLNRPDLTAERFTPDPYGKQGGGRIYRTGDLVKYREDGNLEFIGRIDHQVKIRGYRIELGEIESALRGHPGVREAVVIAREDHPGDKRLVAYWSKPDGQETDPKRLQEYLREKLPEYMVPAWLVELPRLPLNHNGKLDRKALPAPPQAPENGREYQEARTPVEKELGRIWAELLGVSRVGVHDNFFELGGHSLLATRVVSSVREAFRVETPVVWFFSDRPTVASLAEFIEGHQIEQAEDAEIASALEELEGLSDEEVRELLAATA